MEERNRYGLMDLRQLMAGRTGFPDTPQAAEPFTGLLGCHTGEVLPEFGHNNTVFTPSTSVSGAQFGLEMEGRNNGDGGGSSRWPRQETLNLLEIRSRLDYKFKETNQKGPLWDEVSRIMREEHGYQRNGRKCREKFENLYKYYKKTKEGKAGRQDGKHYRFFRQLDALCGEVPIHEASDTHLASYNHLYPTTNNFIFDQENQEVLQDQKLCKSLSRSDSSEFETSSSMNNDDDDLSAIALMLNRSMEKKKIGINESQSFRRVRKSWKAKVEEFVDSRMRKIMDTQEAWMEKMLKTIEQKEQERMMREEEWRKEEAARLDQSYKFWANERAWIEARDTALLEALQKFTRKELKLSLPKIQDANKDMDDTTQIPNNTNRSTAWLEPEISSFIQLRTSLEPRFQESGYSKEYLWEEIVAKMACLGYDWSVIRCKETWDNISFYVNKTMEHEKKGSQNSKTCNSFPHFSSYQGHEVAEQNYDGLSNYNSKIGNEMHESRFHILMNGKETMWENYGVKLNKE